QLQYTRAVQRFDDRCAHRSVSEFDIAVTLEFPGGGHVGVENRGRLTWTQGLENRGARADDHVAGHEDVSLTLTQSRGVDSFWIRTNADMAGTTTAFLSHTGHVEDSASFSIQMRCHPQQSAYSQHARSTDAGDENVVACRIERGA